MTGRVVVRATAVPLSVQSQGCLQSIPEYGNQGGTLYTVAWADWCLCIVMCLQ